MKSQIMMVTSMLASALLGADYVLSRSDDQNNLAKNSFETAGNWVLASDSSVAAESGPSAGNTYTVPSGRELRTAADGSATRRFGGDRLTVEGRLTVHFPTTTEITIDDLVVRNGVVAGRNAGVTHTLCGALTVPDGASCELIHWDNNGYVCTWNVNSDVTGTGLLRLTGRAPSGSKRNFNFGGDNSGFRGRLDFFGASSIGFQSATAMFAAPETATADWMTLNGCALYYACDHRIGANGGVCIDDQTDENRISQPGARIEVAADKSVVFEGPLSGGGTLTKNGKGKLAFLGGDVGFTGEIVVNEGSVELGAGGEYDAYVLRPNVTHVFSQAHPTVAGTLVAAGGTFVVDMTDYDQEKGAPVTIGALAGDCGVIRVDCTNYGELQVGTAYALLTGPSSVVLTAFDDRRFETGDLIGYRLSATDSGDGQATVWMTPQERLPEWIMSATDTDNANNSFTTKGNWVLKSDPTVAATEAPHGGNVYIVPSGMNIRTPDQDGANHEFGGDKLVLRGCIFNKISDNKTLTIADLIVEGGSIAHHMTGRNASIAGGTVSVPCGYDWTIMHWEGANGNRNTWSIFSDVLGSGTIRVRGRICTTYRNVNFFGDNSGFIGKFDLLGHSSVYFKNAAAMPTAPVVPTADWMRVSGCDVVFEADAAFGANGGLYIADESDASRIVAGEEGGRIEVAQGKTVTFNGPLAGDGTLTKRGAGTLVLAGGRLGFSGEIVVEGGKVECAAASGVLETLRVVRGETMKFSAGDSLLVTNLVFAGGVMAFDLTDFDESNPVMLEARTLELSAGGVEIACSGLEALTAGRSYPVMKGPAEALTAAVRTGLLFPSEPHLYSLAVVAADDGSSLLAVVPEDGSRLLRVFEKMSSGDFKTAAVWGSSQEELQAMQSGYRYLDEGLSLRIENDTPAAGDCLYLYGVSLVFKKQNTPIDFNRAFLRGLVNVGFSSGGRVELAGDFMLLPTGADGDGVTLYCDGRNNGRPLRLLANLSGTGRTSLVGYIPPRTDGAPTLYSLLGDNANYVGPIDVCGQTNFYCAISSESSLGGNPPEFRADQLRFNGGGLYATESLTIDDANRGLFTSGAGGICQCNNENGAYFNRPTGGVTVTNTILERTFLGVLSLSTATAGTVLRIDCPISGDGGVRVIASGTVVLGGDNGYSGGTEVVAGTLAAKSAKAFGTGSLAVRAGATLNLAVDAVAMPNGVELGGSLVFEPGSTLTVVPPEATGIRFTVPLFLLASDASVNLADVPLRRRTVRGYAQTLTQRTVTVDDVGRTLVEVTFERRGQLLIVR